MFPFNQLKIIVPFILFNALHQHEQQDCYSYPSEIFREIRSVLPSTEEAYKAILSDTRIILVHKEFTQ